MKRLIRLSVLFASVFVFAVIHSNQTSPAFDNQPTREGSAQDGAAQGSPAQQGSTTEGSATQGSEGSGSSLMEPAPFEKKFWRYLSANNYKNWAPVPGQSGDFTDGKQPHGNLIKMYLNRPAVGNVGELPAGSIIVKENYAGDRSLQAITVMYKNAGYNRDAGDWYWVSYKPDGSIVKSSPEAGGMPLAGRVKACIECHSAAAGGDFAFFND